jgi:AraC-like DNA-binding protein
MKNTNLGDQVVEYIVSRTLDELRTLTIKDITEHFRVSKMHLIQTFKNQKDITPGKFILREKMYRAAFLMEKDKNVKVREICKMTGFSTSDYFIRVFKKYFGIAPCRYREIRNKRNKEK